MHWFSISFFFPWVLFKQITLKRTWAKMPLWHKVKFLYGLVFQPVFLPSPEELKKMVRKSLLQSFCEYKY